MKPARFIFNSDYTNVRSTGETKLSVTIPNDFTINNYSSEYTIGTATGTISNAADCYTIYYTSSKYDYVSLGCYCVTIPEGSYTTSVIPDVYCQVTINGTQATLKIACINAFMEPGDRYQGYGQTITAHIVTFKDPFSE